MEESLFRSKIWKFLEKIQDRFEKPDYINGLILEFTAEELLEHCKKREQYHLALADKYKNKVIAALNKKSDAVAAIHRATAEGEFEIPKSFEDECDADDSKVGYARLSNAVGETTQQDESAARRHLSRVKFFRVFGSHIINRPYRLSLSALSDLEMV